MSKTVKEFDIRESTIRRFIDKINDAKNNEKGLPYSEILKNSGIITKTKPDNSRQAFTFEFKEKVK